MDGAAWFLSSSFPIRLVSSLQQGGRQLGDGGGGPQAKEKVLGMLVRDMWWPCGRTLESWRHCSWPVRPSAAAPPSPQLLGKGVLA